MASSGRKVPENGNTVTALIDGISKDEVDLTVKTFVETLRTPLITGGKLIDDGHFIRISTQWTVPDLTKKEHAKFQREFSILKSSVVWKEGERAIDEHGGQLIITSSAPTPTDAELISTSRNGDMRVVLVEGKATSDAESGKRTLLQIWNRQTLFKTYDLKELNDHKDVYTSAAFGNTFAWSPDSRKLAYLAEKKFPKPKPFFTSYNCKLDKDNEEGKGSEKICKDEDQDLRGEEFALKQSWGEQMKDKHFSVIVVLDIETDKFSVLELPAGEFPTDINWLDDSSLVGTSVKIPDWRLGLIYCSNRESRIFQINADGKNLRFLSQLGRAAMSPRPRPDGKYIIWQERPVDGPHERARSIIGLCFDDVGSPICLYNTSPSNDMPIYRDFPTNCWRTTGSTFFALTYSLGVSTALEISLEEGNEPKVSQLLENQSPGISNILWIGSKFMLVSRSSTTLTPNIELLEIGTYRRAIVTKSDNAVPNRSVVTEFPTGDSTGPSIYVGPEISSAQPNSVPLIVWPHGGPHAVLLDSFAYEASFFLQLGFAILKLNYIGGLGSKKDETDKLLGRIGTLDLEDCQGITEKVVQLTPCLDPNNVFVFGGSHGGFLACHLTSSYPAFYKAAAARNPVCDLNVMIGTSDITDWVVAESGFAFPGGVPQSSLPYASSSVVAQKFMDCSPIQKVANVKAPTLLLIGSEDLRVPMTQGLAYYRALKLHNKQAEVRLYPDCHPLSTLPVYMDNLIHSALWFKRFMK